jgi:predicted tellurium resistance membrane protein TerC
MPIIMFGSNLVAMLMNRLPWLVYLGSAILVYTAGDMIYGDPIIGRVLPHSVWFERGMIAVLVVGVIGLALWRNTRQRTEPAVTEELQTASELRDPDADADEVPGAKRAYD